MHEPTSPRWSTTTKLVVALTIVAILIYLFIQFRVFVGPLLLSFVLAYLAYPLADRLHKRLRIPWRLVAAIIHLLIIFVVFGLLTWSGLAIVDQISALVKFLEKTINDLPNLINNLSSQRYTIGPFLIDFARLDLTAIGNQFLAVVQPLLARAGTLVTGVASSAASTLGWFLFMILISYFILSETGGKTNRLIYVHIPGYEDDFNRMGLELGRIWNSFLRGQFVIITITVTIYTMMLGILGVRFYFGLAILAGMARFIPYVGPFSAWSTYGLVAYFQGSTILGIPPLTYALVVIGFAWFTDSIIDNIVSPRIMAEALSVHPAAVMVAALLGANLLGVVGVVLAAPVLASLKLIMGYIIRKLSDQDPWANVAVLTPMQPIAPFLNRMRKAGDFLAIQYQRRFAPPEKKDSPGSSKDL